MFVKDFFNYICLRLIIYGCVWERKFKIEREDIEISFNLYVFICFYYINNWFKYL